MSAAATAICSARCSRCVRSLSASPVMDDWTGKDLLAHMGLVARPLRAGDRVIRGRLLAVARRGGARRDDPVGFLAPLLRASRAPRTAFALSRRRRFPSAFRGDVASGFAVRERLIGAQRRPLASAISTSSSSRLNVIQEQSQRPRQPGQIDRLDDGPDVSAVALRHAPDEAVELLIHRAPVPRVLVAELTPRLRVARELDET